MVLFNYSTKELTAKIVYYGPGLCGKTTNLQFIFDNLPSNIHKGKMLSLATKTDRTLFFDFLPIDLGTIRGMRTRLQLYTVPGQVFYNTTRKLVLKGADGLVFVADSQKKMLDANIESFGNMEQNLREHGMELESIPHVLQFNKRDLKDILDVEELNSALNKHNVPIYEAVATTGIGVQDTLKAVTRLVLNSLREKYSDGRKSASRPVPAPPPAAPTAAPERVAGDSGELEPEPELEAEPAEEVGAAEEAEPVLELAEAEEEPGAMAGRGEDESEPVLAMAEESEGEAEEVPVLQVAEEAASAGSEVSPPGHDEEARGGEDQEDQEESIEIIDEAEEEEDSPFGRIEEEPAAASAPQSAASPLGDSPLEEPLDSSPLGGLEEDEEPRPVEIEIPGEGGPAPPRETGGDGSTVAIDVSAAASPAGEPAAPAAGRQATVPVTIEVQGRRVELQVTVSVSVNRK